MSFHAPIRVGDKITARVVFDGFDGPIESSNFGGRRIKDYLRQEYYNQHDELVARFICSRMRFERSEMQKKFIYSESVFAPLGDGDVVDHVFNVSVYVPRDLYE